MALLLVLMGPTKGALQGSYSYLQLLLNVPV